MVFSYAVQLLQCLGLNHANILGMCAALCVLRLGLVLSAFLYISTPSK